MASTPTGDTFWVDEWHKMNGHRARAVIDDQIADAVTYGKGLTDFQVELKDELLTELKGEFKDPAPPAPWYEQDQGPDCEYGPKALKGFDTQPINRWFTGAKLEEMSVDQLVARAAKARRSWPNGAHAPDKIRHRVLLIEDRLLGGVHGLKPNQINQKVLEKMARKGVPTR